MACHSLMLGTYQRLKKGTIMTASANKRFSFRIKTRDGLELAKLVVQGRDRTHATEKVRMMYRWCEVLESQELPPTPVFARFIERHRARPAQISA